MDQSIVSTLLLSRLSEFFAHRRPTLDEVLGVVCEIYRIDPDRFEDHNRATDYARAVYIYLASRATSECVAIIGARIGVDEIEVHRASISVNRRLVQSEELRSDLDLACARLIERILLRERSNEPHA